MDDKERKNKFLPDDKQIIMKKDKHCFKASNGEIICE